MIPRLQELGYEISYIGSYTGIEKALIADYKDVAYYGISSGKFRRYFSLKNLTDPFRVLKGIGDARKLLRKIKPDIVFSKGGFVAVPVVRAAHDMRSAQPSRKTIYGIYPEWKTILRDPMRAAARYACSILSALTAAIFTS